MRRLAERVLLIGWDAADWRLITPLLDAGELPCPAGLIDRGVMGNLAATNPVVSPLIRTSIVTGRRADAHGILAINEPDPDTGGVRPVASTTRGVKAIWNILTQAGLRAHVVNWVAGHPAEPIRGVCVSDLYPKAEAPRGHPWPLRAGAVHPARLEETLAALRVHPGDLSGEHLLPFVPDAVRIDPAGDRRLATLAEILAESVSVHAAATWVMEHEPWDFLAVLYESLDRVGHRFMPYHPPRMGHVSEADGALYGGVVAGMYRFHDMMLGRLIELAGPGATVLLVSGHGFHSDHLRPQAIGRRPVAPEDWHRPQGIVCMAGPGLRRDELIHGASVLDVASTVLHLFGLAVGEDMEGRPLLPAFEDPAPPERIASWEQVPGEDRRHADGPGDDLGEVRSALDRLAALGYVEGPTEEERAALRVAHLQRTFHLALVHFDANRPADAATLLEQLVAEEPGEPTYALFLAQCRFALGQVEECRRLALDVLGREGDRGAADLILGNVLLSEGREGEALGHLRGPSGPSRAGPTSSACSAPSTCASAAGTTRSGPSAVPPGSTGIAPGPTSAWPWPISGGAASRRPPTRR